MRLCGIRPPAFLLVATTASTSATPRRQALPATTTTTERLTPRTTSSGARPTSTVLPATPLGARTLALAGRGPDLAWVAHRCLNQRPHYCSFSACSASVRYAAVPNGQFRFDSHEPEASKAARALR